MPLPLTPIQRMAIPVLWQRAVFSAHGIIHHVRFLSITWLCGMALLLRENGNLLEKKKCSYKYLLHIQFMYHKLDSDIIFFFFYVGTTISPIANIFDRFIGENCNFGCTVDAMQCALKSKRVQIWRILQRITSNIFFTFFRTMLRSEIKFQKITSYHK